MRKRVSRKAAKQKAVNLWWIRLILSAAFLGLAYLFASLAIDSGSIVQYAICIVLLYWALAHAIRGIRFAFAL